MEANGMRLTTELAIRITGHPRITRARTKCKLFASTLSDNPAARLVTARELQTEVSSAEATQQIIDWLGDCKSHMNCSDQTAKALPTRVIEVSPPTVSGSPRLRVTDGQQGKYAALSYCWGGTNHGGLTQTHLPAQMEQLDLARLPKTITDTIAITKEIGIPYLWVDAVCILQDSDDDKQKKISTMDRTYRDSLVPLAAASAPTASEGFLSSRPRPGKPRTVIPFWRHAKALGTISFGYSEEDYHSVETEYFEALDPINTRAWCLQENLLALRYLTHAYNTLHWRCNCTIRNLGDSLHIFNKSDENRTLHRLSKSSSDRTTELKRWLMLVSICSGRQYSVPADKLNAISALAATFAPTIGLGYFAGVWERSLLWQLAWSSAWSHSSFYYRCLVGFDDEWTSRSGMTWNRDCSNCRPEAYRAPSWSWASIDGRVGFNMIAMLRRDYDFMCDLISCDTELKYPHNPFGEVSAGTLTLNGVLRKAWFKPGSPRIDLMWLAKDDESYEAAESLFQAKDERKKHYRKYTRGYHDESGHTDPILVHCLPLFTTTFGIINITGLLLVPVGGDKFRRIGAFEIAWHDEFKELPHREVVII